MIVAITIYFTFYFVTVWECYFHYCSRFTTPRPPTSVEFSVTLLIVGCSGAVVSMTFVVVASDLFPALSIAMTCSGCPPFNVVLTVFEYGSCHHYLPYLLLCYRLGMLLHYCSRFTRPLTSAEFSVTLLIVGCSGVVVSMTLIVKVVVAVLPSLSIVVIVIRYFPTSLGVPLIVFVASSNVTPSGKPSTICYLAWPLLSVASILIGVISVLISCV